MLFLVCNCEWVLQSVPPATNSRLSPLPHEPADFYDRSAPVDIPLDSAAVSSTAGSYCNFVLVSKKTF